MPLTNDDKQWISEQLRQIEATLMMARGVDIDLVRDRIARIERKLATSVKAARRGRPQRGD